MGKFSFLIFVNPTAICPAIHALYSSKVGFGGKRGCYYLKRLSSHHYCLFRNTFLLANGCITAKLIYAQLIPYLQEKEWVYSLSRAFFLEQKLKANILISWQIVTLFDNDNTTHDDERKDREDSNNGNDKWADDDNVNAWVMILLFTATENTASNSYPVVIPDRDSYITSSLTKVKHVKTPSR